MESVRGAQPAWVASWLDQGKPEALVTYSRMKRFRDDLPAVIRPDMIPTQDGMVITELDSVPGGIGLTACMSDLMPSIPTAALVSWIGGPDGMIDGFAAMLQHHRGHPDGLIAIVVSEEAKDYRPEMVWIARQLTAGDSTRIVSSLARFVYRRRAAAPRGGRPSHRPDVSVFRAL